VGGSFYPSTGFVNRGLDKKTVVEKREGGAGRGLTSQLARPTWGSGSRAWPLARVTGRRAGQSRRRMSRDAGQARSSGLGLAWPGLGVGLQCRCQGTAARVGQWRDSTEAAPAGDLAGAVCRARA
jgi:hypothetical protein